MRNIRLLGAFLSSLGSVPATADEYYVVRDVSTRQCKVVESPPMTTELVLVKDGSVYFDRSEAQRVLASVPECTSPSSKATSHGASLPSMQTEARRTKPKGQTAAKKTHDQALANSQPVAEQGSIFSIFTLFR